MLDTENGQGFIPHKFAQIICLINIERHVCLQHIIMKYIVHDRTSNTASEFTRTRKMLFHSRRYITPDRLLAIRRIHNRIER